jgi:hypothetical protein
MFLAMKSIGTFLELAPLWWWERGIKAKCWDSSWLGGLASRDMAPDLYKLAWRKNQSVKDDLNNNNWTRAGWKMTTADEMAQLVSLWALISEVQLTEQEDVITWPWTRHEQYTAKSAYAAQLAGSICTFDNMAIWRAQTEGKHRFCLVIGAAQDPYSI